MNRSEALEFFNAAYKRGVAWISTLSDMRENMAHEWRAHYEGFASTPPRVRIRDIFEIEDEIRAAQDTHRETMAMIAWEVCGPAFEQEASNERV